MSLYELLERLKELAEIEKQIIDERVLNPKSSNLDALRQEIATKKIEMEQWSVQDLNTLRQNLEDYKLTLNNAVESLITIYSSLIGLEKVERLKKKYVSLIRKHFKRIERDIRSDHARVIKKLKQTISRNKLKRGEILDIIKDMRTTLNFNRLWRYHFRVIMKKMNAEFERPLKQITK